jgi:hypothetical protein
LENLMRLAYLRLGELLLGGRRRSRKPQPFGNLSPLDNVRLRLLQGRRWRYLRYLHLRQGLLAAGDCNTVMSIGAGGALAELALAIEFPNIAFCITDIEGPRTPHFRTAQNLATKWRLTNIDFGVCDILNPGSRSADFVCSVEVLEHIEDDACAARNMQAIARKALFCLVPYADLAAKSDEAYRRRAWEQCGHYRVGYSEQDLRALFPGIRVVRGCYWSDAGLRFREKLMSLPDDELKLGLADEAGHDIRNQAPDRFPDARGIWILAQRE